MPFSSIFINRQPADAHGHYPFLDRATHTARDGTVLSGQLIRDAIISLTQDYGALYISGLSESAGVWTFFISAVGRSRFVCSGEAREGRAVLRDESLSVCGVLVLGTGGFPPPGSYTLSAGALPLCPSCFGGVPFVGVRSLLLPDGHRVTGDVVLVGERGVVLEAVDAHTLRMNVVGDPNARLRQMASTRDGLGIPLQNLRVELADANGIVQQSAELRPREGGWGDVQLVVGADRSTKPPLRIERSPSQLTFRLAGQEEIG